MAKKFSKEFREQAIEKCINSSNGKSVKEIAEDLGVGYSTLQKWLKNAPDNSQRPVSPEGWAAVERLQAVSKSLSLNESELGAYCREQGIYTYQIKQ